MRVVCKSFMVLVIWACGLPVLAQQSEPGKMLGLTQVHRLTLDESLFVDIYTPETTVQQTRFPVLYLMDGQHYMHSAIGYQKALRHRNASSPAFIVAAINTSIIGDASKERQQMLGDNAQQLVKLLQDDVIPYVDSHFSTTGENIYFGWEYAAGFGLDLFSVQPQLFDGFLLASSPSYTEQRLEAVAQRLTQQEPVAGRLYLSLGEAESYGIEPHKQLVNLLSEYNSDDLSWNYHLSKEHNHFTTPIDTLTRGLTWYFNDFKEIIFHSYEQLLEFGGIEAVKQYYQQRAKRYKMTTNAGENTKFTMARQAVDGNDWILLQKIEQEFGQLEVGKSAGWNYFFARFYLKNGEYSRAKTMLSTALEDNDTVHKIWAALGDTNAQLGLIDEARQAYQHALQLTTDEDEFHQDYQQKLKALP